MSSEDALDFLVIGAPKSGTTSLFEYLQRHPEISLPPDKEAPYFHDDEVYNSLAWTDYIRSAFPAPERRRLSGTITPQYMFPVIGAPESGSYDERTLPRRIRERLPSVRLIAILRDPVERAHSHHGQETRLGFESRSFAEAVDELIQPAELERYRYRVARTGGYIALGEYGRILSAYYDTFPRDQILVLFTDTLEQRPLEVLQRIYGFLGVKSDVAPRNLGKRYNVSAV
ncbi:MAG: sulfotransferase domain-containing protein, partial [Mycobacteriales bacterium]